jgi:hypothetical protein
MQASKTPIVSSSREQRDAVADFVGGTNVVLVANYGSGKTTTIRQALVRLHATGKRGLCLVYNAAMKRELRARLDTDPGGPSAASVHTLHSAAQHFFSGVCGATDEGIVRALTASLSEEGRFALTEVTHIMVDEAQDMKPLFYRLICRLVSMARSPPTLMLVGDPQQEVNRWNAADSRFLTLAPRLSYGAAGRVWRVHALTVSFRCPASVVASNNAMSGLSVTSSRAESGPKARIIRCNMWQHGPSHAGLQQVLDWLSEGFAREDVLVLVPSLKRSTPSAVLQTLLAEHGVHTYQPMRDDQEGGTKSGILVNKVRFCTYHACKGMEAPCVLAMCFDRSCPWLESDYEHALPPPYHVAMTRCKERLTLLQATSSLPVPSLVKLGLARVAELFDVAPGYSFDGELSERDRACKPTAVTEFVETGVTEESSELAVKAFEWTACDPVPGALCAPGVVESCAGAGAVEDVTCLNGHIAEIVVASRFRVLFPDIPAMASLMSPGAIAARALPELTHERRCDMRFEYAVSRQECGPVALPTAIAAALVHKFKDDGYSTSMDQISRRDWWTPEHSEAVDAHLDRVWASALGRRALDAQGVRMEVACELDVVGVPLVGRADFVHPEFVLEAKYVSELKTAHAAQLMLYAHALRVADGTPCLLVNFRTGEARWTLYSAERGAAFARTFEVCQEHARLGDEEFLSIHGP